ncbi:ninjurin-2-like [Haliotis asinina]|uniref:ninjurin-2-like n=1 Tax=Haliotis asinina TaxID=109174 RepID=UPI003531C364
MAPERNVEAGTSNRRKSNTSGQTVLASKTYTTRKTVAQGMLDIALLLANGSQLKALLQTPDSHRDVLYVPQLVLIGLSVTLQICVGVIIIILGNMEARTGEAQKRTTVMNNISVAMILFITVINVFISAFGIKVSGHELVYTNVPSATTQEMDLESIFGQVTSGAQMMA